MNRLVLGAALSLSIALGAGAAVAADMRVGAAGPVTPQATAIMPDGTSKPLTPGQDVVLHEKIVTDHGGQAEVLFLDRSSLRIGPDTDMTIDEFVYSPSDGTGKLATDTLKGLLRFTGGAISKQPNQVELKTPTGILGVRGGIVIAEIDSGGGTTATFLYGKELTLTALNGQTVTIDKQGYFSFIAADGSGPVAARPVPLGALTNQIAVLFHGPEGTGATSADFEAALKAAVKAIDTSNAQANLVANANFFKAVQGSGSGGGKVCLQHGPGTTC